MTWGSAVSTTGSGELFQRHLAAHTVHVRMDLRGEVLESATSYVVHELLPQGAGGLIGDDGAGRIAMPFSTRAMLRAVADSSGLFRVYVSEPG